jgi:hypothetical protein
VNAHRHLVEKAAPGPRRQLRRGLAQAISPQPRTMRRRPPRSLPRSPATEAPSRSNTLVHPADDQRHAFQAVALPTSDRLTNKCPPTGCCEPPAPPGHLVCANTLTQSRCHTRPHPPCQKSVLGALLLRMPTPAGGSGPHNRANTGSVHWPFPVSRNSATEPCSSALRARSTARPPTIDQGTRVKWRSKMSV